jgi:hypothetical protein
MLTQSMAACRRRRCRARLPPHQDEARSLQMPDQPLGGDSRHDIVSMMDAPIFVIAERIGEGIGDFGRVGGAMGLSSQNCN